MAHKGQYFIGATDRKMLKSSSLAFAPLEQYVCIKDEQRAGADPTFLTALFYVSQFPFKLIISQAKKKQIILINCSQERGFTPALRFLLSLKFRETGRLFYYHHHFSVSFEPFHDLIRGEFRRVAPVRLFKFFEVTGSFLSMTVGWFGDGFFAHV